MTKYGLQTLTTEHLSDLEIGGEEKLPEYPSNIRVYTAKDIIGHYYFYPDRIYNVEAWEISDPTIESELAISVTSNGNVLPDGVRNFLWPGEALAPGDGVLVTINPSTPHGWQDDDESDTSAFFTVLVLEEDSDSSGQ